VRDLLYFHRCRPGDGNTCAKDGLQLLCSPQAATFNSSFSANNYVPDCYHIVGTVDAGLRKCRLGRSSPVPATPVSDERGSAAHLRPATLRPHFQCSRHPPLALGSGEVWLKMAVLMYKATHGTAPSYLSQLVRVADLPGRRSLRSA